LTFILILCVFQLSQNGCGPDLEKETFDLYLYDKIKKKELPMGAVEGITACREKAIASAPYYNITDFEYSCCLKTSGPKCEKSYQ